MTPQERFKGHFDFLDQLDEAIDAALELYHDAEESDLEELRHLQREAGLARRTLGALCRKFSDPVERAVNEETRKRAFAAPKDHPADEESATGT